MKFINYGQQNKDRGPTLVLLQYAKIKKEGKLQRFISCGFNICLKYVSDIFHFNVYIPVKGNILYLCRIRIISQIFTLMKTSMTLLNFEKHTLW